MSMRSSSGPKCSGESCSVALCTLLLTIHWTCPATAADQLRSETGTDTVRSTAAVGAEPDSPRIISETPVGPVGVGAGWMPSGAADLFGASAVPDKESSEAPVTFGASTSRCIAGVVVANEAMTVASAGAAVPAVPGLVCDVPTVAAAVDGGNCTVDTAVANTAATPAPAAAVAA